MVAAASRRDSGGGRPTWIVEGPGTRPGPRLALGLALLAVAGLVALALLLSFDLRPSAGHGGGTGGGAGPVEGSGQGDGAEQSGGGGGGGGPGEGAADGEAIACTDVTRPIGIASAALGGLGAVALVAGLVGRGAGWGKPAIFSGIGLLAVALLVFGAWAAVRVACDGPQADAGGAPGGDGSGVGGDAGGGGAGGDGDQPAPPIRTFQMPKTLLIALLAFLLLAILVPAAIALVRRQRGGTGGDEVPNVSAREATRLRRLAEQGDLASRDRVLALYRAFLAWSERQGVPRGEAEAPMEHAQRVAAHAGIPLHELTPLVDAYQVLRLADRDPDEREQEAAQGVARLLRGPA